MCARVCIRVHACVANYTELGSLCVLRMTATAASLDKMMSLGANPHRQVSGQPSLSQIYAYTRP